MNPLAMMMMAQPRLAAAPAAPEPVQPTLGTITKYVRPDATDTVVINFEHTTTTGDFVVLGGWRVNSGTAPTIDSITAAASAMTIAGTGTRNTSQSGGVVGSWIRGATPGAVPIQVNWTPGNARRQIFWAIDVDDMRQTGSPIGAISPEPFVVDADDTEIATTITAINAASRLVGISGMIASATPFAVTNATKLDEDRTGNSSVGVHNSACLWDVALDATGARTITAASAGALVVPNRYAFGVELLPS